MSHWPLVSGLAVAMAQAKTAPVLRMFLHLVREPVQFCRVLATAAAAAALECPVPPCQVLTLLSNTRVATASPRLVSRVLPLAFAPSRFPMAVDAETLLISLVLLFSYCCEAICSKQAGKQIYKTSKNIYARLWYLVHTSTSTPLRVQNVVM